MDSADKFFRESHYNIIRVLLSITGLWPFHSVTTRCAIYIGFLLVVGSGLMFQVMGMIQIWPDIFEVLDCLPLLFYAIIAIIKAICMIYSIPKIKILLIKMKKYWQSPKSDREMKILQSYAIYGEKFGYVYTGIMFSHSALYLFMTTLKKFVYTQFNEESEASSKIQNAQEGVPYRVNYMVDINTYYIPILLHTATCEVLYLFLIISQDVLYLTFVQHCCSLLAALRYLLEDTFEFKDDGDDPVKAIANSNRCYANIVYSIQRHTEAIQFIDIMESLFTLPLFLHLGCVISIISVVGFQVIRNAKDVAVLTRHGIYFCGAVINAFFENWQGQKIIDYSEKVYEYAYNVQWYDMPNATKKLLILIMLRSIKPSQITAGKVIVMSYLNFNAVMRASSSYLMLLRSMQ
ncbi:uncharacterized protein LOC109504182 [Harpegnathos saltator]|uniref:uncharacterized protein LOC109504182 n=1 Tax=Harpegnathos saltator TaxID=610380 RepID=UPI000DBEDAF5|nr:uncharacterized protein LOC109504182 [Harpegnathos saltator]